VLLEEVAVVVLLRLEVREVLLNLVELEPVL
jgi:hypothetical protein